MDLPPGTVDPLFLGELALELKMTCAELAHGRGAQTSAHELSVFWPAFFRSKEREREWKELRRQAGFGN